MEHKQISENIGYCHLVSLSFFQWMQCHFWGSIICPVKEEFVFRYFLPLLNDKEIYIYFSVSLMQTLGRIVRKLNC